MDLFFFGLGARWIFFLSFVFSLLVRTFLFWLREQACFFEFLYQGMGIETDEVNAYFAARGGNDFRLDPPPSGFRSLVSKIRQSIGVVRNV